MTDVPPTGVPSTDARPSLAGRIAAALAARRPPRLTPDARTTLAVLLGAAILGSLGSWVAAGLAARAVERRLAASRPAVAGEGARAAALGALVATLARPGLDQRLTLLARRLPADARLMAYSDARVVLRTPDPDRLRAGLRAAGGLPGYAERAQAIAPDGGIDVVLGPR